MAEVNPRLANGRRMVIEQVIGSQARGVAIYLPAALNLAVGDALANSSKAITDAVMRGMHAGVFPDAPMLKANQEIARRAQTAILSGWRARLPLKSGPYRRGSDPDKDRLSGQLGESLADEAMIRGTTPKVISFINVGRLNTEARHWWRVNYGAWGPKVTLRRPKAYPVTVAGHTVFSLQDVGEPAPQSWLPRVWKWEGAEFQPIAGPADVRGGGTRAALFTDLGFKSVAENVDPVYRQMLFSYFRKGGMEKRFQAKGTTVGVTTKGTVTKT